MVASIEHMLANQHAYVVDGNVWFDVGSLPGYGRLSRRSLQVGPWTCCRPESRSAAIHFAGWLCHCVSSLMCLSGLQLTIVQCRLPCCDACIACLLIVDQISHGPAEHTLPVACRMQGTGERASCPARKSGHRQTLPCGKQLSLGSPHGTAPGALGARDGTWSAPP